MNKKSFQAIRYHDHGVPQEVLCLEELPMPKLRTGEVRVQVLASTIHPSDFGLIQGSYGRLKDLPAIGGREGVGKIVELGEGVTSKVLGKLVAIPEECGTWREFCSIKEDDLLLLPSLVPVDQLAVSILNPLTAWRLLNDFEYLREGDTIIQNAANSAVGLSIIQFARKMNLTCINLVRSKERQKDLLAFGATEVWLDDDDVPESVRELTKGVGCTLGLNSVGGKSALRLARSLRAGGVHVTFGAMERESIRFPTRSLIFDDVRFVGFWLDRWKRKQTRKDLVNAVEEVLHPLAMTEINHPIDRVFSFSEYKDALLRNAESRTGKVLLTPDKKLLADSTN